MPVIVDVEKRGEKELDGAFKISAKGVNMWVRIYRTDYGNRAKLAVSYLEANGWKSTPAIWLDGQTCAQLAEKLKKLADKMASP
jgi:hypothetical protein